MTKSLVLNCGSSTFKWEYYPCVLRSRVSSKGAVPISEMRATLNLLMSEKNADIYIVRFVHGGNDFFEPTVVTKQNVRDLSALIELDPLHNRLSVEVIAALFDEVPNGVVIAVFDTEFFHDLPILAQSYGLSEALRAEFGIRRFGFHGFAHRAMLDTWLALSASAEISIVDSRIVTIQLGSGCSMAAIRGERPIDTTMGFSPNEGLLMSTRCGDIDSGLVTWLQRRMNLSAEQISYMLNERSGWLGMSMESKDFSILLESESDKARLAVELFCYRIRKSLGAYYVALGGLDAIILSGGIAENSLATCHRILDGLAFIGIELIEHKKVQSELVNIPVHRLTGRSSKVGAWIVSCNESKAMLDSVKSKLPEYI